MTLPYSISGVSNPLENDSCSMILPDCSIQVVVTGSLLLFLLMAVVVVVVAANQIIFRTVPVVQLVTSEAFRPWDVSSTFGVVTRTGISPNKTKQNKTKWPTSVERLNR